MSNRLTDIYPVVTSCGTFMRDEDLVNLVRDRIGQDVALVLEHRLKIAEPLPNMREIVRKIRDAYSDIWDACNTMEDVIDDLDPDGG